MEEQLRHLSLYICGQILQNKVLASVLQEKECQPHLLNLFSYKQSQNLSTAMISTSTYFHGNPQCRFTEDIPTEALEKKPFKVRQMRKLDQKSKNSIVQYRNVEPKMLGNANSDMLSGEGLKLVPLRVQDEESVNKGEDDQFLEKMREMKVHQQYMRSRYAENMRQTNKKMLTFHKMDAKATPKVPIYDYDGSLVLPLKQDGQRLPVHYLDLEVNVQEVQQQQENLRQAKIINSVKAKNIVKFDESAKKESLKPVYSSFLKDLSNVQWVQGVQVQSNTEECRKILGYSFNQSSQKKKLDLFKTHETPVKLRLQQVQKYKAMIKRSFQPVIESVSKKIVSSKTILGREGARFQLEANKTIQVANNRALEYLIRQDQQQDVRKKMIAFANPKSFHNGPPQSSASYLKPLTAPGKGQSNLRKKGKVVIKSKINSENNF